MTFGEQVFQARTQLGMTQERLAKELHISQFTISIWECGKHSPTKRYRTNFEKFCLGQGVLLPGSIPNQITTLYVHADEMPKNCVECPLTDEYSDLPNIHCQVTDEIVNVTVDTLSTRLLSCPLRVLK
ncbi:MAG: helix-turn-helix transcriptional regulator [Clostridia bacterium]|nr:helix-turn-helix transcriptional regulator [Clostridia bacterium]